MQFHIHIALLPVLYFYIFIAIAHTSDAVKFHYAITQLWDGDSMDHPAISVTLEGISSGVLVHVRAPFFNDPPNPGGKPGQPFPGLWDYEGY